MHMGVSSSWVGWQVCLERYTRVLMKASLEFPIHFLKIYRCPFHSLWLPRLSAGYVRFTCGVPRAFDAPALGHPTPSNRWEVSALSLTSQAREVRVRFTRRAMHASCDSP